MTYTPNQPVSTDDLKISAPILKNNTNAADNVFGTDHYKFSDTTANKGFHSYIHTPQQAAHPTTTATVPQIYAMQDIAAMGVLDYSRAWDLNSTPPGPGIPTPLTNINSSATATTINASSSISVMNFTGLNRAFFTGYGYDQTTGFGAYQIAIYDPAIPSANKFAKITAVPTVPGPYLFFQVSGTQLFLSNGGLAPLTTVYWTLVLYRLQ